MKKLNIKLSLIAFALILSTGLLAQEYEVEIGNSSATTVIIKEVNRVTVEAYDGKSIVMMNSKGTSRPKRAEGLKALSARGEDNTNIGLNVQKSGNEVTIIQAARRVEGKYTIKVPKDVKVKIQHTGNWEGGKIEVYGVSGEVEVSGRHNAVHLENVTGPALVNTVHGAVTAIFSEFSQSGPTSLVSVYSSVDVTLPSKSKADITIRTPYGEAYSDLEIAFDKTEDMRKVSSTVKGSINGGGVGLEIKSNHGNAYLRKK
ncbi:DUF4097 family beta strand repeat-containing protein [Roseivirga misakiensis]|uniref:Adhesin domain-containing protein n=1 Tax=Roseivirga misakiensis TaxID=1563681 RepID=A0A1E5SLL0_9BACT|nr:hypothetical protein [Roseivirga misakiensis]OEJ99991.1 hypothetical protein BFP71_10635 [Roseivirga misakiensis]